MYEMITDLDGDGDEALVVCEVEDVHRSGPQMIETAATYLTYLPLVVCVVCFKFYAPHRTHLHEDNELCVPALALVFRRGQGQMQIGTGRRQYEVTRVRVTEAHSFGNRGIDPTALECFTAPTTQPLLDQPLGSATLRHLQNPARHVSSALDVTNLIGMLMQVTARLQQSGQVDQATLHVPMPAPLPPIHVDLASVFVAAMRGWSMDRRLRTGAAPRRTRSGQ